MPLNVSSQFPHNPEIQTFFVDLLSHQNEFAERYRDIIDTTSNGHSLKRGGYSRVLYDWKVTRGILPTEFATMKSILAGGILADMGGGDGKMHRFAAESECSDYLNVDLEPDGKPKVDLPTRYLPLRADMLTALSSMRSNSCHITMNGIDGVVFAYDSEKVGDKDLPMFGALADEIARVVPPGGLAFGMSEIIFDVLAERHAFRRLLANKAWILQKNPATARHSGDIA